MISKQTAEEIYHCHREIEAGEKLLAEVQEIIQKQKREEHAPGLEDVFGRMQVLQLGVPTGDSSRRLFHVSWDMAEPIIKTHIANKKAQLERVSQRAIVEANGGIYRADPLRSIRGIVLTDE